MAFEQSQSKAKRWPPHSLAPLTSQCSKHTLVDNIGSLELSDLRCIGVWSNWFSSRYKHLSKNQYVRNMIKTTTRVLNPVLRYSDYMSDCLGRKLKTPPIPNGRHMCNMSMNHEVLKRKKLKNRCPHSDSNLEPLDENISLCSTSKPTEDLYISNKIITSVTHYPCAIRACHHRCILIYTYH